MKQYGMNANKPSDFEIGETVNITDGAFSDTTGKITEIDDEHRKLKVDVDMFGRMTSA